MPDFLRYGVLAGFGLALCSVVVMLVSDTRARHQKEREARIARRLTGAW